MMNMVNPMGAMQGVGIPIGALMAGQKAGLPPELLRLIQGGSFPLAGLMGGVGGIGGGFNLKALLGGGGDPTGGLGNLLGMFAGGGK